MRNDWPKFQNLRNICIKLTGLRLTGSAQEKKFNFIKTTKAISKRCVREETWLCLPNFSYQKVLVYIKLI